MTAALRCTVQLVVLGTKRPHHYYINSSFLLQHHRSLAPNYSPATSSQYQLTLATCHSLGSIVLVPIFNADSPFVVLAYLCFMLLVAAREASARALYVGATTQPPLLGHD